MRPRFAADVAAYFAAEYLNVLVVSGVATTLFLGGWLAPLPIFNHLQVFGLHPLADGFFWLFAKVFVLLFFFLWIRATFPRYRYDQVMRLGWKIFIPVTLVWIVFIGVMMQTPLAYLFH